MRALSIQQPWAWLIANGHKDIENRTWDTKFRGAFLIHAGMKIDIEGYRWVREQFPEIKLPKVPELEVGGIVGRAEIVETVTKSESPWFTGAIGYVITAARPLQFEKLKGKLGFFEVAA